jgi:4-amino-4-deoxy-L-arabinose transferase-like glycosyltransferase
MDNKVTLRTVLVHELTIILVAALVIRVILVLTTVALGSDGAEYCWTAQRMFAKGLIAGMKGDFLFPFYSVNRRLPVYPFLGSLLYRVVGDMVLAMQLISVFLGLGAVALAYAIARELFEPREIAAMAAGIVALHPVLARSSVEVLREVPAGFFILLALYLLLLSLRVERFSPVLALVTGVVGFVAFLTRLEAAVLMPLFCMLPFADRGMRLRKKLAIMTCVFIGFWVLEVPYAIWLHRQTGHLLFNQGMIEKVENRADGIDRKLFGAQDERVR